MSGGTQIESSFTKRSLFARSPWIIQSQLVLPTFRVAEEPLGSAGGWRCTLMYDDAPQNIARRIDEAISLVENWIEKWVPDAIATLTHGPRFIRIGGRDVDWDLWYRKLFQWNFVKRLHSLARARKNQRMTPEQRAAHDRILSRMAPLALELQKLRVRLPPLIVAQLEEANSAIRRTADGQ